MQTTDWTKDPVLRDLLGPIRNELLRDAPPAKVYPAGPRSAASVQPPRPVRGFARLDAWIGSAMSWCAAGLIESFAAYGCAMYGGYNPPDIVADSPAPQPLPRAVRGPIAVRRKRRLIRVWKRRREQDDGVVSLVCQTRLSDEMLREIGLYRDPVDRMVRLRGRSR